MKRLIVSQEGNSDGNRPNSGSEEKGQSNTADYPTKPSYVTGYLSTGDHIPHIIYLRTKQNCDHEEIKRRV
jgi:hypothetical protein